MRTVRLRDGSAVRIRPIEPGDRDAVTEAFERLSPEFRYRRFFSPIRVLTELMLTHFTAVDHHHHEALVALDDAGAVVAVARFIRSTEEPEVAEMAVTVVDAWQGRGLGRVILERLVVRARQEGVGCFSATVLGDNPRALRVIQGLGESSRSRDGAYVELRVRLPARRGLGTGLNRLLREAGTGSLVVVAGAVHHALTATQPRHQPAAQTPPPADGGLRTVVAGVDGSASADVALRQAVALAARFGARLHLVSAHGRAGGAGQAESVPESLSDLGWQVTGSDAAEAALERARAALAESGVEVVIHARHGDPVEALVAVAIEEAADLIVVGSKGARSARRLVVGSVAGDLVRLSPCGVYVVRTV